MGRRGTSRSCPGEMALIQKGEVHGTYNTFSERLVFLAILAPAHCARAGLVDVSQEEPWASLRAKLGFARLPAVAKMNYLPQYRLFLNSVYILIFKLLVNRIF